MYEPHGDASMNKTIETRTFEKLGEFDLWSRNDRRNKRSKSFFFFFLPHSRYYSIIGPTNDLRADDGVVSCTSFVEFVASRSRYCNCLEREIELDKRRGKVGGGGYKLVGRRRNGFRSCPLAEIMRSDTGIIKEAISTRRYAAAFLFRQKQNVPFSLLENPSFRRREIENRWNIPRKIGHTIKRFNL